MKLLPLSAAEHTLHMLLCPNDPPSPNGIYGPKCIDAYWAAWIASQSDLAALVHIEYVYTPELGEVIRLWRTREWNDTASARAARASAEQTRTREWWMKRWQTANAVRGFCKLGVSRKTALEAVTGMIEIADSSPEVAAQLRLFGYYEVPSNEDLADFMDNWRAAAKHTYSSAADLRQAVLDEEDEDEGS